MLARSWDRNSVCLAVRLSVTHMLCDEMKEHTGEILTLHERVVTLVFSYQMKSVGDVSLLLPEICA